MKSGRAALLYVLFVHGCAGRSGSVAPSPTSAPATVVVDANLTGSVCSVDAARTIADNHEQDIAAWQAAVIKCEAREQQQKARGDIQEKALNDRSFWADYGPYIAGGGTVAALIGGILLGAAMASK